MISPINSFPHSKSFSFYFTTAKRMLEPVKMLTVILISPMRARKKPVKNVSLVKDFFFFK